MVRRENPSSYFGNEDNRVFYAFVLGCIVLGIIILGIIYSRK